MDVPDTRLKADHIEIEIGEEHYTPHTASSKKVKLYQVTSLPQKIQLWLIVGLSIGSLLSNLTSLASSLGFLTLAPNVTSTYCPSFPK